MQDAYAVLYEPIYLRRSPISLKRGISSECRPSRYSQWLIPSYLIIESSGISEPIQVSCFGLSGNLNLRVLGRRNLHFPIRRYSRRLHRRRDRTISPRRSRANTRISITISQTYRCRWSQQDRSIGYLRFGRRLH